MISLEEYMLWKQHPVTASLKEEIRNQIENAVSTLCTRRSPPDPNSDQFLRGVIHLGGEVLSWVPEIEREVEVA